MASMFCMNEIYMDILEFLFYIHTVYHRSEYTPHIFVNILL